MFGSSPLVSGPAPLYWGNVWEAQPISVCECDSGIKAEPGLTETLLFLQAFCALPQDPAEVGGGLPTDRGFRLPVKLVTSQRPTSLGRLAFRPIAFTVHACSCPLRAGGPRKTVRKESIPMAGTPQSLSLRRLLSVSNQRAAIGSAASFSRLPLHPTALCGQTAWTGNSFRTGGYFALCDASDICTYLGTSVRKYRRVGSAG